MAGVSKKAKKNSKPKNKEESSTEQEEIDIIFEGRNLEAQDFFGLKQFLLQLFPKTSIDVSQLSDMLISQAGIGSVLKQCEDDEGQDDDDDDVEMVDDSHVFGITSVINLSAHRETPCVQQIFKLLNETNTKYADKSIQKNISEILSNQNRLGLIINERLMNIPAKISNPILNSLLKEIQSIRKRDKSYSFDYYVMICKAWKLKGNKNADLIFCKEEENFFVNEADYGYEFNITDKTSTGVGGNWDSEDEEFHRFHKIIIFNAEKLNNIVTEITNNFNI